MSRTSADRRLAKGNLVNLYTGDSTRGWRIVKQVPLELGLRRVAQGKWWLLQFENGSVSGFMLKEGPEVWIEGQFPGWSPTTITAKESQVSAGLYGPSQTLGFGNRKRLHRDLLKQESNSNS